MARRTKDVTIPGKPTESNRDGGKTFFLTEKDALDAERWAKRALAALGRTNAVTGVEPGELEGLGLVGVAAVGVRALATLQDADSEELMDEMVACIQIRPDPANPQVVRKLVPGDIEEIKTIWDLRREVLELHLGFSLADAWARLDALSRKTTTSAGTSSTTPTSRGS